MKTNFSIFVLAIAMSLFSNYFIAFSQYSGGSGTESEPYQISSAADLEQLMQNNDDWNKHFELTTDIDVESYEFTDPYPLPIGKESNKFTGTFDGKDHKIENLKMYLFRKYEKNIGLFGYNAGDISNLGLDDFYIDGDSVLGGMCGVNEGNITNCYAVGIDTTITDTGGFCCTNFGNITNCNSNVITKANISASGFVSYNYSPGKIKDCFSMSSVSTYKGYSSGFCGYNTGEIDNCFCTGRVTSYENSSAGFVNFNYGTVKNCYSVGRAYAEEYFAAGFCIRNEGTISDCYANGSVQAGEYASGFCDFNTSKDGIIENCHSTGHVKSGYGYSGGFVRANIRGRIFRCYSTGRSVAYSYWAGGFCSGNTGSIIECYCTGYTEASDYPSGFCAINDGGYIGNCYTTSQVYGYRITAGFCGKNKIDKYFLQGEIENCYSSGKNESYNNMEAGFVGENDMGKYNCCYWDKEASGVNRGFYKGSNSGVIGKSTSEMNLEDVYKDCGWDFSEIWTMDDKTGYPQLKCFADPSSDVKRFDDHRYELSIHPNPFTQSTTINYELREAGHISLELFDMLGNRIETLVDCWKEAGKHQAVFNVRNTHACSLTAGMYMLKMTTSDGVVTEKVVYVE